MADLLRYYSDRAGEYERVYDKPERQDDLAALASSVAQATAGHRVLEVACGTGYWTERYAADAEFVLGVDGSEAVLEVARRKVYPPSRVQFAVGDAYALGSNGSVASLRPFNGAVAAFWWSHIPRARVRDFVASLHACLAPGAVVWMADNRFVAGSSTPISHSDEDGNTYQRRHLSTGAEHVVLKNFPTEHELREALGVMAVELEVRQLEYFWAARYVLAPQG